MKHNCCSEANWLLEYNEMQNGWYVTIMGAYTIQVDFCPWCGEQLPVTTGVPREKAEIVADWIDHRIGKRITFQEMYLSLVGTGGLLEQLGLVEPI